MKLLHPVFFFSLLAPAACLLAQTPAPNATPAAPAFSPSVPADKVVISVGALTLTASQFNQLIDMLPEQSRAAARGPGRRDFANEVVRMLVLAQEGKKLKLDESPGFETQAQFQRENLLAAKAFAVVNKVDDAELRQYYDSHKVDFEQVRARHILIRAAGSPIPADAGQKERTEQEALAKVQELRKKIADGADFAALASQESDDAQTKGKGGELDFFHRGQMVAPFEEAAFKLNVGELSEPVKSPFGYHLIQVEAKKAGSFEEAKPEIERRLQTPQKSQAIVEDLVKKATVVIDSDFFGPPNKK